MEPSYIPNARRNVVPWQAVSTLLTSLRALHVKHCSKALKLLRGAAKGFFSNSRFPAGLTWDGREQRAMHSHMSASKLVVIASFVMSGVSVHAAPVTFNFSGTVLSWRDLSTSSFDTSKNGLGFTGSYTLDIGNVANSSDAVLEQQYGCFQYVDGLCTIDAGAPVPNLILSWSLTIGGDTWTKQAKFPLGGFVDTVAAGGGIQDMRSVNQEARYRADGTSTLFDYGLSMFYRGVKSTGEHETAPDMYPGSLAQIQLVDRETNCSGMFCAATGFVVAGGLSTWEREEVAEVPEPNTLVLAGLGAVLAIAGRGKQIRRMNGQHPVLRS